MVLDLFCLIVLLAKPTAVVLSTWIGMGGWGCPISTRYVLMGMLTYAVINPDPISDSDAESITNFIILAITCLGPLMGYCAGDFPGTGLLLRKKWQPILFIVLTIDKKDASLCACRHMSLATYVISASGCVAQ